MRRLFYVLSFLAAVMAASVTAQAQRGNWEVLGEQRSRPGVESLVIEAGRRDGRFDAIRIAVSGGNILLLGVDITFGNGDRQRIRVRTPMFAGSETDAIQLDGGARGRFIRSVEVRYGSLGFLGRPTVKLLGHPVRGRPGRGEARFRDLGPRWQRVGVERVSRDRERDVIQLSRRDGRFDAIMLRVRQSPVRIRRVSVVFGNGQKQDFDLPNVLRPGDSDVLELRGRRGRFIDRIEMVYRDVGSPRRARVAVFARKAEQRPAFRDLGPNWELVATERPSRQRDRDVIQMSRRDGRFDAMIIRVKSNDVRFRRVRVVYGNGRAEDLDVDREIGEGEESEVLELRGRRGRFIDRIELIYRTAARGRPAEVEVWARSAERRPAFRDLGPDWKRIAAERPSRQRDRDIIQMSRRDGRFDALVIRVQRNDVRFRRVRVVYGNGRAHDLNINREIGAGEESDVLELRGNQGRFIDRIELLYRTAARGRPAEVEIWGREFKRAGFRPLGPRWDEIGVMRASRGGDRDVIELSRRDGRFDAVLVRVKGNDVRFRRLRVVYGNGRADDLEVDRVIRQGEESDVLELRGARGRFLDRIELVYATRGGGRLAQVEIWGRKSLRR